MNRLVLFVSVLVVCLSCALCNSGFAYTDTWIGTAGDFGDPTMYQDGYAPLPGDTVVINNGGTMTISASDTTGAPWGLDMASSGSQVGIQTLNITGGTAFTTGGNYSALYVGDCWGGANCVVNQSGGVIGQRSNYFTIRCPEGYNGAMTTGYVNSGFYNLSGGEIILGVGSGYPSNATQCEIGWASGGSVGVFTQTGGWLNVSRNTQLTLGYKYAGSLGIYYFMAGTLSKGKTSDTNTDLLIGNTKGSTCTGIFRGQGKVDLNGQLWNDGMVIAESYNGSDSLLDMSEFKQVGSDMSVNTFEAGWFTKSHGSLLLPPVAVAAGTNSYVWGINQYLINSAQFTLNNATTGTVSGSLLATDLTALPITAPANAIGVWNFVPTASTFDSANFTFRYDDTAATSLGVSESNLRLFQLQGGSWVDLGATPDTTNHLLSASNLTSLGYFAVGTSASQAKTLTGNINLQNWAPVAPLQTAGITPSSIEIQDTTGTILEETLVVTLDSAGNYSITHSEADGNYLAVAKVWHWLAQAVPITITDGQATANFSLKNGDINGDNFVEDQDYSLLGVAWYSGFGDANYSSSADLNGDGYVEDQDYSIMGLNWYQGGDNWL
jgi:hypothetical protein